MSQLDFLAQDATGSARVSDVWAPTSPAQAEREEQAAQLDRCAGRLADEILAWLRRRLEVAPVFHASDLVLHVQHKLGGSPESALRVLRELRRQKRAFVVVESRSASRYCVERVP